MWVVTDYKHDGALVLEMQVIVEYTHDDLDYVGFCVRNYVIFWKFQRAEQISSLALFWGFMYVILNGKANFSSSAVKKQ